MQPESNNLFIQCSYLIAFFGNIFYQIYVTLFLSLQFDNSTLTLFESIFNRLFPWHSWKFPLLFISMFQFISIRNKLMKDNIISVIAK